MPKSPLNIWDDVPRYHFQTLFRCFQYITKYDGMNPKMINVKLLIYIYFQAYDSQLLKHIKLYFKGKDIFKTINLNKYASIF